jgi:hypothetical protein
MLQKFARVCRCRIFRGLSLLCLAPCCTVSLSRWRRSGINTAPVASTSDQGQYATRNILRLGLVRLAYWVRASASRRVSYVSIDDTKAFPSRRGLSSAKRCQPNGGASKSPLTIKALTSGILGMNFAEWVNDEVRRVSSPSCSHRRLEP